MTSLTDACGPHCGTAGGQTVHCVCCHSFSWGEADGCARGWDGSSWFDFAETHVPGSHELDDYADRDQALVDGLLFGAMPSRAADW